MMQSPPGTARFLPRHSSRANKPHVLSSRADFSPRGICFSSQRPPTQKRQAGRHSSASPPERSHGLPWPLDLVRQRSLLRRRPGVCVWQGHSIRSAGLRMRTYRRSCGIEGGVRFHGVGILARIAYCVWLGCRAGKHSAVRHGRRTRIHSGMRRDRAGIRNSRTGGYTASANRPTALRPADRSQQAQHHPANQYLLHIVPPRVSVWEPKWPAGRRALLM